MGAYVYMYVYSKAYRPVSVFRRYCAWWNEGKGTDAWDTGPVAKSALQSFWNSFHQNPTGKDALSVFEMERKSRELDEIKNGFTAGANAAHRCSKMTYLIRVKDKCRTDASRTTC